MREVSPNGLLAIAPKHNSYLPAQTKNNYKNSGNRMLLRGVILHLSPETLHGAGATVPVQRACAPSQINDATLQKCYATSQINDATLQINDATLQRCYAT